MDNKVFDQILRERFKNDKLQEQSDGWQKLSVMLSDAPGKRRVLAYWKIAAALLLVLGLGIGFSFLFQKQNKKTAPYKITGNQNIQKPVLTPSNHLSPDPTKTVSNKNALTSPSNNTLPNIQKNIAGNATTPSPQPTAGTKESNNHSDIAITISKAETNNMVSRQSLSPLPENNKAKQIATGKTVQQQVVVNGSHSLNPITTTNPTSDNTFNPMNSESPAADQPKTAIAFGGGMNYGVLNTGYNLNLSAKHALGKHVFVEGSVAFLYNSQAEKSSFYAAQNFSPTRPAPGQVSASRTTNPAASNFYYLSVNPSMGYQINKTIALSAGPDLQQRIATLGQDGTAIYTPGRDPRIIPQLDLGFTGKADFMISPKIETSILFRNGLSNLLKKPDLHPYLNRRYIQVQLNYNFLLGK